MPATNVRAVCTWGCGQVDVPPGVLELFVCASDPDLSHYTFKCSACDRDCVRPADPGTIEELVGGGYYAVPYEPDPESAQRAQGEPLTFDHLLDLMLAIDHYNLTGEGAPWSPTST